MVDVNPMAAGSVDPDLDDGDFEIIRSIQVFREEADEGRRSRLDQNRRNRDVFLGRQDWSHKQEGQSTEFIPKVGVSVEQMTAFIKRGLVQFGDWFSVDLDKQLRDRIEGESVRSIIKCFFRNLWAPNQKVNHIETVISDGVKNGLLESLLIFKVHGSIARSREFTARPQDEGGEPQLETEDIDVWRLRIDLVRPEDYYPDPTGNGLYEIHRVERDLHDVIKMAEAGIYDRDEVNKLINTDHPRPQDEERSDKDRGQDEATNPQFRRRVVIDEFWGTLLNSDGTVMHENVVAAVANDRFLIRKPEPNPFWHQESPFVVAPLIRVPWSVWHKALYDNAAALNIAINEMFNLILDGGLASVWGTRQVRLEDLEDPGQVSGGVSQGMTLAVKNTLPHGQKVMENLTEGEVPQDAMSVFEFLNREYNQTALTNDLKMGALPSKQVLATEVLEASQSQSITLDGIVSDLETEVIEPLIRKSWLTILQNADEIPEEEWLGMTDRLMANLIMSASPAERYQLFVGRCSFKVDGLSSTVARARDFQKLMAMMQSVQVNPALFQAFMVDFSPNRTLRSMIKALNLNPDQLKKSPEERAQLQQELQRTVEAGQLLGATGGGQGGETGAGPISGPTTGGQGGAAAEANQLINPSSGLAPNQ